MLRLRGRGSLTIVLMVAFTLLVIIYHILSNEVDDISSGKINSHLKIEDVYPVNDLAINSADLARRQQLESRAAGSLKSDGSRAAGSDDKKLFSKDKPLFKGHKIVHLDLKGAPPKLSYYKYLLPLLVKLGATGILIEYEDMFPFHGEMQDISAGNCYSKTDILAIQEIARDNGLLVIPLIQTFGHLEFILKLDNYKDFREVFRYPQAVCPSYNRTLPLLHEMIDQMISLHPNIRHIHIGADEVYHIGECTRCLDVMAKQQWGKRQLFLAHTSNVARYIKQKYPKLSILMWDDEFREISAQEIIESGMHKLVEPVIWKYTPDPSTSLNDILWDTYSLVWKEVWIATAFKGATAPDRYYTDIAYHLENHQRWLEIITRYSHKIKFKGAILTGWQRYDHFSVLCELLPSSLPSLAINLAVLQSSELNSFPMEVPKQITEILECEDSVSLSIPEPQYAWTKCNFQGAMIYSVALRLYAINLEIGQMEQDNTFKGWLKEYNVKHSYSSPSHVEHAVAELDRFKMEIVYMENEMRRAMDEIYDKYTIQEWLETFLEPLYDKVVGLWEAKEKILIKNTWPRRPLTKQDL